MAAPNGRFQLQHLLSGNYITEQGSLGPESDAADLDLVEQEGCAEFPELTLDASGEIAITEFEDGSVFGFVETHAPVYQSRFWRRRYFPWCAFSSSGCRARPE